MRKHAATWLIVLLTGIALTGCGGGGGGSGGGGANLAITSNPASTSVTAGSTATFTAAASGNPAPTVQWQVSGDGGVTFTNVAGGTSASLSFTVNAGQNGFQYRAVFTNSSSSATTTVAMLTVQTGPAVTTNPANASVLAGDTATFTAAASGNPSPTVQWQVSSDGGATFSNVVGATAASLSFTANGSQSGNQYRAAFTNAVNTATTAAATLTVLSHVVITTNPSSISVTTGATATFTAAASGNPAPTVQWQVSSDGGATFSNVAGGTATSMSFTANASQNGCQYRAVFINSSSTATSTVATLTVTAPGKQWRTAQQIESNSGTAVFPLQAVNSNGNVISIWSQASGQFVTVWANRFDAGAGSWGTAQRISSATDTAQTGQLSLASDLNGNALAVWTQTAGASGAGNPTGIWSSRFDAGTQAWSAPLLIGGDATLASVVGIARGSLYPQVAIDASGNAFAIWSQNNGLSSNTVNVWVARYTSGSWGSAHAITTAETNVANQRIGFDSSGNAIVSYTITTVVNGLGDTRIKALHYTASSTTWNAPQFIAPDTTYSVLEPQLAVGSNGAAVAVWSQSDGTNTNVVSNHYDASTGLWSTAQIIDTPIAGSTAQPQVAVDASGNSWAVWSRITDTQGTHIWGNHFTAGGSWGTPQIIDTSNMTVNGPGSRYPQVAFDVNGKAMAVWTQSMSLVTNGPNYMLIVAAYNTGGTWGAAQVLESAADSSSDPQILFDASGNATAVWDKTDAFPGVNTTIFAARYQ